MERLDIAIAGAGPAGLAAALYLDRAGHRVTVFERFAEPAPVGSGLILQPTGLTVLADLGLLPEILGLGSRIDRLHGSDAGTGREVLNVRYSALGDGRFGLGVHRAALFGVLFRAVAAARIAIETEAEIEALDEEGDRPALRTKGGRRLGRFDLVVDATGARSALAAHAGRRAMPRPLTYGAFWASLDWSGEGFDAHALLQRYEKARVMIGVLPIGRVGLAAGDQAAFFWSLKPGEADAVRSAGLRRWKDRVAGLWPATAAYLDQIDDFDRLALARYHHATLKVPAGRRLAVIGDSAHATSPQLGQGANMALLDAAALAYALERSVGVEEALRLYVRMRRRHVRVFQALSRLLTPFYQSDSRLFPVLRDRLVPSLARIPPAPRLLASMVSGTLMNPFAPIGLEEADWRSLGAPAERRPPGRAAHPAEHAAD